MNEKNLKNGKASQFRAGEEQAKRCKKAGEASGRARREQKRIKQIVADYIAQDVKKDAIFSAIAEALGITGKKSIKELFAILCLINSAKKGELGDLEKLMSILGEDKEDDNSAKGALDALCNAIREGVKGE